MSYLWLRRRETSKSGSPSLQMFRLFSKETLRRVITINLKYAVFCAKKKKKLGIAEDVAGRIGCI